MIFVFGSNLAGRHGAGAAAYAYKHEGAVYGQGVGHFGNSYALPTKNSKIISLTLGSIAQHVDDFIEYAKANPDLSFKVTRIGCGLAGFKDEEIAPLFKDAPVNCWFDHVWFTHLPEPNSRNYWGTM